MVLAEGKVRSKLKNDRSIDEGEVLQWPQYFNLSIIDLPSNSCISKNIFNFIVR